MFIAYAGVGSVEDGQSNGHGLVPTPPDGPNSSRESYNTIAEHRTTSETRAEKDILVESIRGPSSPMDSPDDERAPEEAKTVLLITETAASASPGETASPKVPLNGRDLSFLPSLHFFADATADEWQSIAMMSPPMTSPSPSQGTNLNSSNNPTPKPGSTPFQSPGREPSREPISKSSSEKVTFESVVQ